MQYVIQADNLTKIFGDSVAVNNVSLHLTTGECLGLLGPNGAGKTSTIKMIYALSPVTSGEISVFGMDIRTQWREIKARIGVCQQDNSLDPDLSVQQNLEIFGSYFKIPKKTVREKAQNLLEFFALDHRKDSKVTELSGGMMRRLVLARALINDPRLLILDEPTTGLDPQSRHQVWEKLEKLRMEGLSILLTTHYMEEASRLCDRLIIMDHGEILVQGKPTDLIKEHAGRSVIEVARPGNELRDFIRAQNLRHDDLGFRMLIYGQENDRIFDVIRELFCGENCSLRMSTLEDVFLRLTGRQLRE